MRTHCTDCGNKLGSTYSMTKDRKPICPSCYTKRQRRYNRAVKTWMYLHREEVDMLDIPIEVVEYCSQGFENINNNTFGYDVPWDPTETMKISIGPALLKYGTICGGIGNKFSIDAIKFLVENSREEYVIAEVITNPLIGEIQNMAIRWKEVSGMVVDEEGDLISKRDHLSYQFSDLVYSFGGSLRPDCMDYDGWDTFESE